MIAMISTHHLFPNASSFHRPSQTTEGCPLTAADAPPPRIHVSDKTQRHYNVRFRKDAIFPKKSMVAVDIRLGRS